MYLRREYNLLNDGSYTASTINTNEASGDVLTNSQFYRTVQVLENYFEIARF